MAMNEREIFETALEIADPKARLAFLDKACRGNSELRAKVESLLKSHENAGSFLDVPALDQMERSGSDTTAQTIVSSPAAGDGDGDDGRADLSFLNPPSRQGSIGRLGHYEILQVLGQGAFGIVFKAFDEKLHRHVAIKAMNPQLAATSPPRKRFLREARSVAALKHENVVQIYSVEEEPLPYLAMEFVDGSTLADMLDNAGPLGVSEILYISRQMAAGLAAAHEKGLIHRDIKPGNILIEDGAERKVKITDFGLARAADDATMTRTGTIAGTPMYMAPEQAMGQTLDHRADLFSLGSVMYQMACGRPPFRGASAIAVLKRVVDEEARPIQDILPEVPDWLCTIIAKLHAKKPDDRFQTAKEVAELLGRCQSELQTSGQVSCVPRSRIRENLETPAHADRTLTSSATTRSKRPIILLSGILATAAIIAAVVINRGKNDTKPTSEISDIKSEISNYPDVAAMPEPATDPDRALAEWVLSLPGQNTVQIEYQNQTSFIGTGSPLPAGPFSVKFLGIVSGLHNEADVLRLGTVEHLGRIDITSGDPGSNQGITDRALDQLSRTPLAKSLHMFNCYPLPNVTDASIDALNRFQKLEYLTLSYECQITDAGFSRLKLPLLLQLDSARK